MLRKELSPKVESDCERFHLRSSQLHIATEVNFEAKLGERLAEVESHLTWRMFAFWAPTALAVIGTGAGVISLLLRRW